MNDEDLANLLGSAAPASDTGFRIDVFARIARNARRNEARRRAVTLIGASTGIGVLFGLAQAAGFTLERAQPLFEVAVAAGLAYFVAMDAGRGAQSALARWVSGLRLYRL